jgi:putative PIN family toxin of toxin-antitoxin system
MRSPRLHGKKPLKAFLDANTIVSGLIFEGNEATLLELGRIGAVQLVTNNYVLAEVQAVLRRAEFSLSDEEFTGLIRYLHECLTVIEDPPNEEILSNSDLMRDKKDIPVALGATNSGSSYLVTGDKELLEKLDALSIITSSLLRLILSDLSGTPLRRRTPKIKRKRVP